MEFRRRLPHLQPDGATFFVTWRLWGSLPGRRGPVWLEEGRVAEAVARVVVRGDGGLYALWGWVLMPEHVHLVMTPVGRLGSALRWVKGVSAREANLVLGRVGMPFWQEESYDRVIRGGEDLRSVLRYVEENPVKRGLVKVAEDWRWGHLGWVDRG